VTTHASTTLILSLAALLTLPAASFAHDDEDTPTPAAVAQDQTPPSNVPTKAQQAESSVENAVRRFHIGVQGGVALDPELIDIGAHGSFGPIFHNNVEFRPGFELGFGEITTLFGINLDVLYVLPGSTSSTRWSPYLGAGPNFSLSHRSVDTTNDPEADANSRFDFSDTDFKTGLNFIAGARSRSGMFFEMRATAYGVATVRLLAGFNF
jgi:hypothetical protein